MGVMKVWHAQPSGDRGEVVQVETIAVTNVA
jgi:hypothetical protein